MGHHRLQRNRRDGRITESEDVHHAAIQSGNANHDRMLKLQQSAGNQAVVQRFREYDEVAASGTSNVGKLVSGPGLHYTVEKPKDLAGHFSDFHITYHRAIQGKHPHFYFTDTGAYRATGEKTQQNKDWIELASQADFDELRDDAPKQAAALLSKSGFPGYEGATATQVEQAHAAQAKAKFDAAADAAKEAADVRTVVARTSKAKPKPADVTAFAGAMQKLTGATEASGSADGRNGMKVTLVYEKYADAKAAQLKLSSHRHNTKPVEAEVAEAAKV